MDTLLGIGQAFELDRGMIPHAGVDAFALVKAFDIACQAGIELSIAHEAALMRKLCLQRMEEALLWALSWQLRGRFMLGTTPCARRNA